MAAWKEFGFFQLRLNMILKQYCHSSRKEGDGNESTGEKEERKT